MQYSTNHAGVPPGQYHVSISSFREQLLDNEQNVIPRVAEVVPDVYNRKSELTAEITKGTTIDFDLKSNAGPITQPDGKP